MAIVITVMNMKGGVGKTTVAAHLAGALTVRRQGDKRMRVLAIDYDPQFNMSQMFIETKRYYQIETERKTSLAILQDDETKVDDPFTIRVPSNHTPPEPKALVHNVYSWQNGGKLDIVPSTLNLMYLALGQPPSRIDAFRERFRKFIDACRSEYDVIIIDCHPAGSILTKTSLENSDHVIIPVIADTFAARGVGLMKQFIAHVCGGTNGATPHILFNCPTTKSRLEEEKRIRADARHQKDCVPTPLRHFKAFQDPRGGKGWVWSSKKPYRKDAFRNLRAVTADLVARMGL